MRPVVVGLDGSASAASAVRFAAGEAVSLGVPLRIVHGYGWPVLYACLANVPYRSHDWEPAGSAVVMVDAVARRVRASHPDLTVQAVVVSGSAGAVLLEESARASLVVIGSRGTGGVAGLLSGPVAGSLAARAGCPVVVVPEGDGPAGAGGQVCVGVDGSARSLAALRFACGWAHRRGASVDAVHVSGSPGPVPVRDWVREVAADRPDVPVLPVVVRAVTPADALLAAGRDARLIVLGSPRQAGVSGLGQVGRAVTKRATCPVVIVPEFYRDDSDVSTVVHGGAAVARGGAATTG